MVVMFMIHWSSEASPEERPGWIRVASKREDASLRVNENHIPVSLGFFINMCLMTVRQLQTGYKSS